MFTVKLPKAATSVDVDFDSFPEHIKQYVIQYGLTQSLNDAAASVSVKDLTGKELEKAQGEALGMSQKRLDNLKAGLLRASTGRESNPVAAEAKRLATDAVAAAFGKKGVKRADALKHANFAALVTEFAARASTQEQAKAIVALRKSDESDEIEIEL